MVFGTRAIGFRSAGSGFSPASDCFRPPKWLFRPSDGVASHSICVSGGSGGVFHQTPCLFTPISAAFAISAAGGSDFSEIEPPTTKHPVAQPLRWNSKAFVWNAPNVRWNGNEVTSTKMPQTKAIIDFGGYDAGDLGPTATTIHDQHRSPRRDLPVADAHHGRLPGHHHRLHRQERRARQQGDRRSHGLRPSPAGAGGRR